MSSLVDHSYCSDFSTFYGNCEADRKNNRYGKPNLWSHFDQKIDEITNPLYLPTKNVIWPSVAPFSIVSIFLFKKKNQKIAFDYMCIINNFDSTYLF